MRPINPRLVWSSAGQWRGINPTPVWCRFWRGRNAQDSLDDALLVGMAFLQWLECIGREHAEVLHRHEHVEPDAEEFLDHIDGGFT